MPGAVPQVGLEGMQLEVGFLSSGSSQPGREVKQDKNNSEDGKRSLSLKQVQRRNGLFLSGGMGEADEGHGIWTGPWRMDEIWPPGHEQE